MINETVSYRLASWSVGWLIVFDGEEGDGGEMEGRRRERRE